MRESSSRCKQELLQLHACCSHFLFLWPSLSQPHLGSSFILSLSPCCPAVLSLPPHLSLVTLLIQNTSMNLSSLQRTDDLSPLSLCLHLSLLHICLLHLYSFPSGLPADKVSLHRTNETITLVLFFTACPACSGKLLLNCSSVLQMNCPDNSISLLSSQRSRGAGEDLADSWLRVTAGPQSQEENHFILSESGMDITDTDVCFYNLHF